MSADLKNRWLEFAHQRGWEEDAESVWQQLLAHYSEPARAYHTLEHLTHCFREFDAVPQLGENRRLVEMALWFHDVIYDPKARDNELKSCEFFTALAVKAGLNRPFMDEVCSAIMLTRHDRFPFRRDEQLVVDIDLSILGAEPAAFAKYEQQVRQEYAWLADKDFAQGRLQLLEKFLQRQRIFITTPFYDQYEAKARQNLMTATVHWRKLAAE